MSMDLTAISTSKIDRLVEYWWTAWVSMHWGFWRNSVVYWCCSGQVSPARARAILEIDIAYPIDVVIFHRELVTSQLPEHDLAKLIVDMTPKPEREVLVRFVAGKNAFERGEGATNSISQLIDEVTIPAGMPRLRMTDDGPSSRIASARMLFDAMRRNYALMGDNPPEKQDKGPAIFISSECPELISAIPSLMQNPKDEEDTDPTSPLQEDVFSAAKNAFRDYPSIRAAAPIEVLRKEAMDRAVTPTGQYMNMLKFDHDQTSQKRRVRRH